MYSLDYEVLRRTIRPRLDAFGGYDGLSERIMRETKVDINPDFLRYLMEDETPNGEITLSQINALESFLNRRTTKKLLKGLENN